MQDSALLFVSMDLGRVSAMDDVINKTREDHGCVTEDDLFLGKHTQMTVCR